MGALTAEGAAHLRIEHLRRHVLLRPTLPPQPPTLAKHRRLTKVAELEQRLVAGASDGLHDVLGLKVAVDNAEGVAVRDRLDQLD